MTTGTDLAYVEPRKPKPRDHYFEHGFFSMQGDQELLRAGKEQAFPTSQRLDYLAQAKANRWGHASFDRGELLSLLGCSRPTMKKAMETLRRGHAIAPASSEFCIVMNCKRYRRADKSYATCMELSHKGRVHLMWSPETGWESRENEWHGYVNQVRIQRTIETTEKIERTQRTTEVIDLAATLIKARPLGWRGCEKGHYWQAGSSSLSTGECWKCKYERDWAEAELRRGAQEHSLQDAACA